MAARLTNLSNRGIAVILGALVLVPGLISLLLELTSSMRNDAEWLKGFMQNFSTEMLGAIVTFALLYVVVEQRDRQRQKQSEIAELKARLIREMGSKDNADALKAVRELQAHGWITDGSLRKAFLNEADLRGANLNGIFVFGEPLTMILADLREAFLSGADLRGAYLEGVNFEGAWLRGVNLEGARVTELQLTQAHSLKGATMPDGSKYDGRFYLEGDLEEARRNGIDVDTAETMAEFYRVSVDDNKRGQE